MPPRKDYTGQKFNMLTAVKFTRRKDNLTYWLFRCDCGKEVERVATRVKIGRIKSCGCYRISKMEDYTGQKFGSLTAIKLVRGGKDNTFRWFCECDCGRHTYAQPHSLKIGKTRGCGYSAGCTTHGLSRTPEYSTWTGMKRRCYSPNHKSYKNYGGKGIIVCDRWLESFENFLEDMGNRPEDMSIERKDRDGNYEPSNCEWADNATQLENRSATVIIKYNGKTQSLKKWSEETGLPAPTIRDRMRKHKWSIEKALTTPVRKHNKKK